MSFEEELSRISRQPAWVLVLYPDYCANEFGVSPCAASGTPCYFTYPTCKDKTHYARGSKQYRFCGKAGLWLKDVLPYIKSIQYNSMELDPRNFKTTRADLTVSLHDDAPLGLANPDKQSSNLETAGSFWKNWLARNPNYFRRRAELYLCFARDPVLIKQYLYNQGNTIFFLNDREGNTFLGNGAVLTGLTIHAQLYLGSTHERLGAELWSVDPATGLPDALLAESTNEAYFDFSPAYPYFAFDPIKLPEGPVAWAVKRKEFHTGYALFSESGYNPYPGGYRIHRSDSLVWTKYPGADKYFEIYTLPYESRLFFRGVMEKFEQKPGEASLTIKDLLKSLDCPSHSKQSDKVTIINMGYNPGTGEYFLLVFAGNELPERGIIVTESGKYLKYSGVAGPDSYGAWTLHNMQFAFGSSAPVNVGEKVKHCLIYGRDDAGLAAGLTADMVLLDLVCNRAGINSEYIAVVDSGATLSADVSDSAADITVSDGSLVPDQGVIKIDDEFIVYGGREGNVLKVYGGDPIPIFYYSQRGAFGTGPSGHGAGAKIMIPTIARECLDWLNNNLFRAKIAEPVKTQELFNQFCEQALAQAWQNEDGEIEFQALAPLNSSDIAAAVSDKDSILEGSSRVTDDPALQNTRVMVYYNPVEANPGSDPSKYQELIAELDQSIEGPDYLNASRPKTIFANWIYRGEEAIALASRLLALTSGGVAQMRFKVELKDCPIEIGQFVQISSRQMVDESGVSKTGFFEIVSKKPAGIGRYELTAMAFGFQGLSSRIGPQNPVLVSGISGSDTTIILQLSAGSYSDGHFASAGQIRIEDEKISYSSKNYDPGTQVLTLGGCVRGILGTAPAPHSAGTDVLLLYAGASQAAKDQYAWDGDSGNKLDADGDGVNEAEGYVIW